MLNKQEIKTLIDTQKLIESAVDVETQLTPNGFDVTAGNLFKFRASGKVDFSNKERVMPETEEIPVVKEKPQDNHGWWYLEKGVYKVRTNEIINLTPELTALSFSRSTLLRMGAYTQHGVWDAGFRGRGEFVLVVDNLYGIKVKQNARLAQLVFFPVASTEEYKGVFQDLR